MPRIKGLPGPYRFLFTSFDCGEPPHVHVEREDKTCKFWLQPLELARSIGTHLAAILEKWYEHCG
jgi:hypothetical protein